MDKLDIETFGGLEGPEMAPRVGMVVNGEAYGQDPAQAEAMALEIVRSAEWARVHHRLFRYLRERDGEEAAREFLGGFRAFCDAEDGP